MLREGEKSGGETVLKARKSGLKGTVVARDRLKEGGESLGRS